MRRVIIYILTIMALATVFCADAKRWEYVSQEPVHASAQNPDNEKLDIYTLDGYIYIYTPRATNVKVLSIVGQTICDETIQAGRYRLRIPGRGIYILKVGAVTRRITI